MSGDAAGAIRVLYLEHGDTVYRTIYGIVLETGQAESLTLDTFVRADHEWEPRHPADERTWLLAIATGLARPVGDVGGPALDLPLGRDFVGWLMRPLEPDQRALVVLHHCLQLPRAEVAEVLAIPENAIASGLESAMRVLRGRAAAAGTADQTGERGPMSDGSPDPTDIAIIDALKQDLMRAPVSLPPVDAILSAAEDPEPGPRVSISPLPPPGLISRRSRVPASSLSRVMPYLVGSAAAAVLIGIIVFLSFHAVSQIGPVSAGTRATPRSHTSPRGGATPSAPPTLAPTLLPPTPAATPPPSTPAPPAAPAAPPVSTAPPAPAPPAPPPATPPPPPGQGHGHGHGPGGQGNQQ